MCHFLDYLEDDNYIFSLNRNASKYLFRFSAIRDLTKNVHDIATEGVTFSLWIAINTLIIPKITITLKDLEAKLHDGQNRQI